MVRSWREGRIHDAGEEGNGVSSRGVLGIQRMKDGSELKEKKKKGKWCWIPLIPDRISDSPSGGGERYSIALLTLRISFCTAAFFRRTHCLKEASVLKGSDVSCPLHT